AEGWLEGSALAGARDGIRATVERGLDLVFVVDVTSSMKPLLERFQAECRPLVAALAWTFPSSRVGAVLYRDGVETVVGFGGGADVVAAVRAARPEGGGDVPEGLHLALRAALSLGRFGWRSDSAKHIVVVADAPPPTAERPGTLALAEGARRQGGYRTHAIYDEDERTPREKTPFLPELARRGGGAARKAGGAGGIGFDILSALFPEEAQEVLRPALEVLLEIARSRA
ncbi:MAG: vWA domain-containing protein, partial [Planctomycetota bacterium]